MDTQRRPALLWAAFDFPRHPLAREDGDARLVVSLTNIRKIHDLVFMRRQGDVLLIHLADTAFKRLGSVRYPRNGKPSAIADEALSKASALALAVASAIFSRRLI